MHACSVRANQNQYRRSHSSRGHPYRRTHHQPPTPMSLFYMTDTLLNIKIGLRVERTGWRWMHSSFTQLYDRSWGGTKPNDICVLTHTHTYTHIDYAEGKISTRALVIWLDAGKLQDCKNTGARRERWVWSIGRYSYILIWQVSGLSDSLLYIYRPTYRSRSTHT